VANTASTECIAKESPQISISGTLLVWHLESRLSNPQLRARPLFDKREDDALFGWAPKVKPR